MPVWPVAATHAIFVGGLPMIEEFEASENISPGMLVQFTNATPEDKTIKPAVVNSTSVIGVADISVDNKALRGGKRTSAYAALDVVKVIKGPINVMLRLVESSDIDRGEMLGPVADGEVGAYVCDSNADPCQLVAQSLQDVKTWTAPDWILVELKIP